MSDPRLANAMLQIWTYRSWQARVLWPVSLLFGAVLRLRRLLYRARLLPQTRLAVPVIVVGNIFIGGTGKTPLTLWLVQQLQRAGYRPGVISRGYGASQDSARIVDAQALASEVGDEPLLLARRCPVAVHRRRVQAGLALLAAFPEVDILIADDGLQHLALARDLEIMLFDGRGCGNGWLLPAGPLREPVSRSCDLTVVNLNAYEPMPSGMPQEAYRMQLNGTLAQQLMNPDQIQTLASLGAHLKIVAAAGIGHPARFFAMLRAQGVQCTTLSLPDHFDYLTNPFERLSADMILITEKDAVKCRQQSAIAADVRIWVVAVEAQLDPGFIPTLLRQLNQHLEKS